jgi:hypothetical protein
MIRFLFPKMRSFVMNELMNKPAAMPRIWRHYNFFTVFDRPWIQVGMLFFVLLLLMPPDGLLTDNEENYFQLAAQAVATAAPAPNSAVFDASPHRFLSEFLLGNMIRHLGFETTQIITRTATAAAFAVLLPVMLRAFALTALDGVIVVVIFALAGQSLMGDEWIFHGFESKVVAYGFVMIAFWSARMRRGLIPATALCVTATYFHFLVGTFWFGAILLLRLIGNRRELVPIVIAGIAFVVMTIPLTGMLLWTRLHAETLAVLLDTPPPDVIFSLIREPWHAAPFTSRYDFVIHWLPGFLLAGGMLAGCILIARTATSASQRTISVWLALLLAYLFLALIPVFIERHTGAMGKFYPFRPSALILLFWLALCVAWLNTIVTEHARAIKLLMLALIAPSFLVASTLRISHDLDDRKNFATDKQSLVAYLSKISDRQAVVLIDPAIEASFLDFERQTSRPSLISWKFAPTNDPELREWYRRMEFRRAVFHDGCTSPSEYSVAFLLATPADAGALAPSCGPVVLEMQHWRLIQRSKAAAE